MKIIENGEWAGLSKGAKETIRDRVAEAAKIQARKLFTGPNANDDMKEAARKFEEALNRNRKNVR